MIDKLKSRLDHRSQVVYCLYLYRLVRGSGRNRSGGGGKSDPKTGIKPESESPLITSVFKTYPIHKFHHLL